MNVTLVPADPGLIFPRKLIPQISIRETSSSILSVGVTWTGTFTPTDNIEDTTNVITVGTTLTDLAGNAPLAGNSTANYTIDTKEPVVSSVVMSDSALTVGETSTLTITFS